MKKRIWGILLALALCMAALCVGAGAAETGTEGETCEQGCIAHGVASAGTWYTYHIKDIGELQASITNGSTWTGTLGTVTVTFLKDVTVDKTFAINKCYAHIVLDLNRHTISGSDKLGSGAVIDASYSFTSGVCVAIQNGTIENTAENGTALMLSNGAVTLENVTVTGDTVLDYPYTNNFVSPFLGGISFTKLRAAQKDEYAWSMQLKTMLGKGCYFVNSAGDRIDANRTFGSNSSVDLHELENARVMACDHRDSTGSYTFVDAKTKYGSPAKQCSTCGNFCPHDKITDGPNPTCTVCGLPIVVAATNLANKVEYGPYYFTGLDDALNDIQNVHTGRAPIIALLADTSSACSVEWYASTYDGLTIDLAGHTLTLTGGNRTTCMLTTIRNSSDTHAEVHGTVNVYTKVTGGSVTLTVPETKNNLTISEVNIKGNGDASLAGGSFGSITIDKDSRAKALTDLLVSGYYFADSTSGEPAALFDTDGNNKTELANVTVKPCSHNGVVYNPQKGLYTCPCGQVTYAARVTKGGTTTYYADMQEAFDAADGGVVKLVAPQFPQKTITVPANVTATLDLSGTWYSPYSASTPEQLSIAGTLTVVSSGSVQWVDSSTTEDVDTKFEIPVTVQSGGKLTVPDEYSDGEANRVHLVGGVTVEGGGSVIINGGSVEQAITLEKGSAAVITGGQVSSLALTGVPESVTISGGSFGNIKIYETYYDASNKLVSVWPHEVTFDDFAGLLTDGKSFKLTSGEHWANNSDVKQPYSSGAQCKALNNVAVADAPLTGVTISGKSSVEYGVAAELTASATPTTTAGEGPSLTYQWYSVNNGAKTAIDGATGASYTLPTQDVGSYAYAVSVNCNGYVCESGPFTVTVEPQLLQLPIIVSGTDTKAYDGTAAANIRLSGFYAGVYKPEPVYLTQDTDFTLENAVYGSANVGEQSIRFTATLLNPNYTFLNPYMDVSVPGTITKAPAPTVQTGTLTVANGQAASYTFDFKSLLRTLEAPLTYGEISYSAPAITMNTPYYNMDVGAALTDGVLTLPIQAVNSTAEAQIGAVTVTVSTTNYEDITLTLKVSAVNKKLPVPDGDVTLSRSTLTYGQTLDTISLSGTMEYEGRTVAGTFAWQEPDAKLNAGEHAAGWVFTPAEEDKYLPVTGTASITVNKAAPSGAPKYTPITASGRTLADANLTANESWPAGSVEWVYQGTNHTMDPATEVTANTAYEWLFTPHDTINYESLRGTLTPYRVSSGGGGGGSTATKAETTTNPDGSTTKTESKPDGTVIETTTNPDGSVSKTTTKKDGSSVTESKDANGSTGTVKTDVNGRMEAEAKVSEKAVEDAKKSGEAVKVPTEVKAGENSNSAPTVKVELPKNAGETKIEIPVSDVNGGTVAVIVHEDGTEELVKDSKPTEDGVQLTVDGSATVKIIDNSKDFIDTRDHWSRDEVNFVVAREIFNGVGGNSFGVDQPMTRGMVNTVLARLAGVDTTPKDGQKWYEVGTAWAKANGITDGTNPEASVTREQLATLLYRFSGTPTVSGTLSFADAGAVSDYAQNALLWATQNGIMNGVGNNCVAPGADAQRAQVAAMMARYLKNA